MHMCGPANEKADRASRSRDVRCIIGNRGRDRLHEGDDWVERKRPVAQRGRRYIVGACRKRRREQLIAFGLGCMMRGCEKVQSSDFLNAGSFVAHHERLPKLQRPELTRRVASMKHTSPSSVTLTSHPLVESPLERGR